MASGWEAGRPTATRKNANSKEFVPDEKAVAIVRRIFDLCAAGKCPNQIACILAADQILTPTNYYYRKTGKSHNGLNTTRSYAWYGSTATGNQDNKVYLGHMPDLRASSLSYKNKKIVHKLEGEQKELAAAIPEKEGQLERLKSSIANVDAFIEKARRYTAIDELTPELLQLFIQRIEIGERSVRCSRSAIQDIRIVYRDISTMDTPMRVGDQAPKMSPPITSKEELIKMLT